MGMERMATAVGERRLIDNGVYEIWLDIQFDDNDDENEACSSKRWTCSMLYLLKLNRHRYAYRGVTHGVKGVDDFASQLFFASASCFSDFLLAASAGLESPSTLALTMLLSSSLPQHLASLTSCSLLRPA